MKRSTLRKRLITLALAGAMCAAPILTASAKTIILSGDTDKDGLITANDALRVLRRAVDNDNSDNVTLRRMDVDKDGIITSGDAVKVLRESVGLEEQQPDNDEPYTVNDGVNDFSAEIFKRCYEDGKNTLVSPLSIYTALAMENNGANGVTRDEMLKVLGGVNSTEEINYYLNGYISSINKGDVLRTANSIFIMERDDITIKPEFITTIQNDYFAEVFNAPANNDTVQIINDWVKKNTQDMIDSIIDEDSLTPDVVSVLLNAVSFRADWAMPYEEFAVKADIFNNYDGTQTKTDFLYGEESCYISDEHAVGFIKNYARNWEKDDEHYSFVAILPDEDIGVQGYIDSMDDSTIKELVNSRTWNEIDTVMPKFKFECDYKLNEMLSDMGMSSAFVPGGADFSNKVEDVPIYIDSVIHKTFIELDESGTKAAAVTAIIDKDCAAHMPEHEIVLDRPFIFVIYDMNNNIPVFMGTVMTL